MSSRRGSTTEIGLETTNTIAAADDDLESSPTLPLDGVAASLEPALAPVRIGRFPVIGELGRGGMGVAYVAYDENLDRSIAIKLVRSDRQVGAEAQARLLREAQALARINHPNVVNVLEAGTFQSQVYMAMELVRGDTIDDWLDSRQRHWREVVAVFNQAARGLQAVHAAGLVHRDFKPSNVIVGDEGRVRILDFGIVSAANALDDAPPATPAAPEPVRHATSPATRSSGRLTETGTLLGTPAYMAPEQLARGPADARSDQFAFCVSLYEGLYGQRPFAGESLAEIMAAIEHGEVRAEPRSSRVPGWVRAVVLRGLRADPAQRWPSMDALITALERDPARRRRAWLLAAAVVALGAGGVAAGMALTGSRDGQVCRGAQAQLAGAWDDARRAGVERALLATNVPYAASTWSRAADLLDGYARDWTRAHTDACEATAVRKEQSQIVLDQRMACLSERRNALAALTTELGAIDAASVQHALKAVSALPPLEPCADPIYLGAQVKPPVDAEVAAAVIALRERLAHARELEKLGKFDHALALARELAGEAERIDYMPLHAEIDLLLGILEAKKGAFEDARMSLERAFFAARTARYQEVAVDSAAELILVVGLRLARAEQGDAWSRHARAELGQGPDNPRTAHVLSRMGGSLIGQGKYKEAADALRAALDTLDTLERAGAERGAANALRRSELLANLGVASYRLGKRDEAGELYQRALELGEELFGPEHPDLVMNITNLGTLANARGRDDEAMAYYRRALSLAESGLGAEHPFVASLLNNIARVMAAQGDPAGAEAHYRRSIAMRERTLGPEHPDLLSSVNNLGELFAQAGKHEQAAEQYGRALAIAEKGLGPEHPHTAVPLMNMSNLALEQGKVQEARAHIERAMAIWKKALGPEHRDVGKAHVQLGKIARKQGRPGAAVEHCRTGLALIEKADGPDSPELSDALIELAEALIEAGQASAAVDPAERALRLRQHGAPAADAGTVNSAPAVALAEAQVVLARALLSSGQGERARELLGLARETYEKAGDRKALARIAALSRR
jgi:eukaryotic-like serine/threonine-protein kinase